MTDGQSMPLLPGATLGELGGGQLGAKATSLLTWAKSAAWKTGATSWAGYKMPLSSIW